MVGGIFGGAVRKMRGGGEFGRGCKVCSFLQRLGCDGGGRVEIPSGKMYYTVDDLTVHHGIAIKLA